MITEQTNHGPLRFRSDKPVSNPGERPEMSYRSLVLRVNADGVPSTLDMEGRSVEVIGASENPVNEFDYDRWEYVPTVLMMSGCQLPSSGQMPLLDTHSRYSTASVIGSYRGMRTEGDLLVGRAVYSSVPEAEGPWTKTAEGHLTDYSVGRRDISSVYVPADQTEIVEGKTFTGPVRVVTKWIPKEMSVCPIGADETAKARAVAPPQKTPEKENTMDEKLRKYLERRGLPTTATEQEAYRFLDELDQRAETRPAAVATPAPTRSEDEIRAEAIRIENTRTMEITALCDQHNVAPEKRAEYLKPEVTVEQVRKEILELVVERSQGTTPGFVPGIQTGADEKDKFRAAAEGGLMLRAGRKVTDDEMKLGARDLAGFSLREMARECLRISGQATSGNILDMVGRALTTSDFPLLLSNVANKSLLEGWETQEETWQTWVAEGSVSDFKTNTAVRPGETGDLDEIREDDEYQYGDRTEQQEQYRIATYGKLFAISRQTIINDDLGALTDIPMQHGQAASRKVGDVVYAVPIGNSAMGDGVALFHASHGNLMTGAALSVTSLGAAELAMGLQKDIGGKRRLNIMPKFFIAPLTLKTSAETFFRTTLIGTQAEPNVENIFSGAYFTRVYEPRLDDASTKAWYLAAAKGQTVKVFFLNGNKTPYMETKQGWSKDGVEMKVRIDVGAKAMAWKGLVKNPGP